MADENKQILIDVSIDNDALKQSREKAVQEVATLDKKLSELKTKRKKDLEELERAISEGSQKEQERIQKNITLNEAESKSIQQSRREQIKIVQLSNDLLTQSDGKTLQSKEQLRKARQLEQIQLDQLKGTIAENAKGQIVLSKTGEQSVQQLNKYNTGLIEFGKSVNDGRNNVGNYTQSIIEAIDKTGLLSGSLGTVKDAFNAVRSGAAGVKEGFDQFKGGVSASVDVVKDWFVTNADANKTISETATSSQTATGAVQKLGSTGVSSMSALRAAIASTGIGLLVIALAAALNYLRQVDPIVEKFEQLMSGLGEAITVIGKGVVDFGKDLLEGLTDPLKLLETINPINIVKRFTEVGGEAVKAGKAAADLTARLQDLEDTERNIAAAQSKNNIEADKNRKLSEDRTRSAKERLLFLQKAQEAELRNLELEKKVAAERFAITQEEYRHRNRENKHSDEFRKKLIDEATQLTELNARIQNKAAEDAAEAAKLKLKDQADYLKGVIALLNEELRYAELTGRDTIALKQKILKEQLKAELSQSDLSNEERLALERKYQNDLLALDQESDKQRKALQDQIDKIALDRIIDGRAKEIAAEAVSLQSKLDAIKGNGEKEKELRQALAEESALKVLEINSKYDALNAKQRADVSKSNLDLISKQINDGYQKQIDALDIALAGQEITQQEYEDRKAALNEARLQDLLQQQLKYQADRQLQDEQLYQQELSNLDKSLADKKITLEEYNNERLKLDQEYAAQQGQTEIETQAQVNDTINQIDAQRTENAKAQSENRVKISQEEQQKKAAIEQATLAVTQSTIQAIGDLLSMDEKNRKKNANLLKAIAYAEVLINMYQEISGYWKGVGNDAGKTGVYGAAGSVVLAGGLTAAAAIRGVAALAKINAQKFRDGGFTYSQDTPTFKTGGWQRAPKLGLIGEAGTEYVAPNWQVNDPVSGPVIQRLEAYRRTRVPQFADGGMTATASSLLFSTPTLSHAIPTIPSDFVNQIASAVITGMQLAPPPIVSVQEIQTVSQKYVAVQQQATL